MGWKINGVLEQTVRHLKITTTVLNGIVYLLTKVAGVLNETTCVLNEVVRLRKHAICGKIITDYDIKCLPQSANLRGGGDLGDGRPVGSSAQARSHADLLRNACKCTTEHVQKWA